MSVKVIGKADHANNKDADDTNDAYKVDLSFALVVTPSTENGDDMIVRVIDSNGNIIASGRIAGEAKEGEKVLTAENGSYVFKDLMLIEGNHNFTITLEGIQNLERAFTSTPLRL